MSTYAGQRRPLKHHKRRYCMNIQDMIGDSFHEGMSIDEINEALSNKKFADLSTGNYVDANKYKADLQAKDNELNNVKKELNSRMSGEEKAASDSAADKARIQELEDFIRKQTISTNRDKVEALTSDVRGILNIKTEDKDYSSMLDVLSNGETEQIRNLATYINKIVKDSYEKGKQDASRDNLGSFANGVGKTSSPNAKDEVGSLGKELAHQLTANRVDPNLYFKRDK